MVNSSIADPYARVSLDVRQQYDSHHIITESSDYGFLGVPAAMGGICSE